MATCNLPCLWFFHILKFILYMNVKVEGRFPSISMYTTFWHHSPCPDHKSSIGSPLFDEPCTYPCSSVYFLKTAISRLSLWSDSCRRHILVDVSISLHSTLQHLQGTFCHVFPLHMFWETVILTSLTSLSGTVTTIPLNHVCPWPSFAAIFGILNAKISFCKPPPNLPPLLFPCSHEICS